jgi:hypothetical protein
VSDELAVVATVATIDTDLLEEGRHARSPENRGNDTVRCTFCGRELPPYARRGFLPPPRRRYRRGARPRIFWAPPLR